jgi:hypothetical protein
MQRLYFFKELRQYTHHHPVVKFFTVLLFFAIYLIFTVLHYGAERGIFISLLTWSFFVFCTPIADAGILIDFPLRLFTGLRMLYAELIVTLVAFLVTLAGFLVKPHLFEQTLILKLYKQIIFEPQFWPILILSALGTFFSVYFGDEVLDVIGQPNKQRLKYQKHFLKYRLIVFVFLLGFTIVLYYFLLQKLNITIPLL